MEDNEQPMDELLGALPPEEGIEDLDDEHDYDGDFPVGIDEDEEDDEEDDEEHYEQVEWADEPYPDPSKEPWDLKAVKQHYYDTALHEFMKEQGVDVTNKKAVSEALNNAWKNSPADMRAFDKQLEEHAAQKTKEYEEKVYNPYYEQYENARIAEEFKGVIEILPEVNNYIREMEVIGPTFFQRYPHLIDSPAKALPILLNVVKSLGKIDKGERRQPSTMERGKSPRKAPKKESGFGKTVRNPGEWVMSL